MATTFARYTADGSTAIFAVPCPYIEQAHIKVRQNGFLCTLGVHYDFLNTSQIRFRNGFVPPANALIEVRRETISNVPLVVYQNGAVLSKDDLNTATLQNLFISQEIKDYYEAALVSGFNRITNGDAVTVQEAIDAAVQGVLESSLLADLQARISDIDFNAESILENSAAINTMQSVIDSLLEIDGVGIATFVLNEQQERIDGDTALAETLALIGAVNGDNTAFILDLSKVRVDASTSLGTRLSGIDTAVGENTAAIASETTARTSADSALASEITTLASQVSTDVGTLTAAISSEASTRASADSALSTTISNLASTVSSNYSTLNAAISSEASTRASADSANASAISTLQSRVTTTEGDISSAALQISAHTSAIAAANGTIASLAAQYMIKTDVNGRVAGFGLYNDGATSEFIVLADKFAIVDPSAPAGSPVVPFVVTGGVVYMQNVVIGNALIAELNVGKLVSGTLNADISVGTGKVIWSNGTYMKVTGIGFGSSGQFLEWFGPYFASFSSCTEANAIQYLKTDGSAYFGGTLHAGVFQNAGTSTQTGTDAEIVVGPFGTNGNSKTVTYSYTFSGAGIGISAPTPSATLKLYRKIGTGSEVEVASQSITGSHDGGTLLDGSKRLYQQTMSGSWTFTDNNTSMDNFTYRLDLHSRYYLDHDYWGTGVYATPTQRLTVTSVEA